MGSAGQSGAAREGDTALDSRQEVQRPSLFKVLLHNDHYTTMEFVVEILRTVFGKSDDEAVRVMLDVHESGSGLAGVYPNAVAETKVSKVTGLAEEHGFPLKCSMEPE